MRDPSKAETIMLAYLREPSVPNDEITARVAQELAISDREAEEICQATAETTIHFVEQSTNPSRLALVSMMCLLEGLGLARLAREYEEEH